MQNTLGWGLDKIKWTECGSLLMLEDGHMEFIILLYFCECELFFPHNKLKKKKAETSYCLCLGCSLWRAVTVDYVYKEGCVPMWTRRDERPEQFGDVLVSQGCYTVFCKPGGLKLQKFIPPKFWRLTSLNSRCQQPLSEPPGEDPSLLPLAGNPWGSRLPDCTPPTSASVSTWPSPRLSSSGLPSVCLSPALFSQLPGTHPKGSVTSSWLDHLCKDPISRKVTFSGSRD